MKEVWKWAAITLASVLGTTIVASGMSWTAFMKDSVTVDEVHDMIAKESPYFRDQALLRTSLERIENEVLSLRGDVTELTVKVAELGDPQ